MMKPTNSKGFSLLEVMIALTIFAVFITAYMTTQGYNITDSIRLQEELKLRTLCESTINDIIVNPPEFKESITLTEETKAFEDAPEYEYSIKYEKFVFPDLSKIQGELAEEEVGQATEIIAKNVKEAMELLIWQVRVTVTNKDTGFNYSLTTWLYNKDGQLQLKMQ